MNDDSMHSVEEWIKRISFYRKLTKIFFWATLITVLPICMIMIGIEIVSSIIFTVILSSSFFIGFIGFGLVNVKIDKEIAKLKEEYEEIETKKDIFRETLCYINPKRCFLKGPEENGFIAIIAILDEITVDLKIMQKESAEELFELN